MKRFACSIVLLCLVMFGVAYGVQAASEEEAKAFAQRAAAFAKDQGKERAMAEFNNPNGSFTKGEFYIFANDFHGISLANGGDPRLVGQNQINLHDVTDLYFMRDMVEVAKTKGGGWANYLWRNPVTGKIQAKHTWVQKVPGTDYFVGCGIYK